ncbi:hypothetical protein [Sansalvadorimonas verongulae]|uniref:hypothetical protein n=1 Tax=Sansalvadorimonas verongulae TaxID=2172824 RepID=UPI0012BD725A|nr:hypothetical protein [Sansalvadorimonas verongulae]MTI14961.1 hypothetical protein [Sansalvadorimonas verongulae]
MPQKNTNKGGRRPARRMARRVSYPLRLLTSDAITGQAIIGLGGTLVGAGTGAVILGSSVSLLTRNRTLRAASIFIGILFGGAVGSTLGGVSGVTTGLFVGMVGLPFAVVRSFREPDPARLVTPLEHTVKGGWVFLSNPERVKETLQVKYGTYFTGQKRLLDKDAA